MSRPRKRQACDCPRASHQHGTRGMYDRHKCHCAGCQPARTAEGRAAKPLKHDWVDPAPARERIALLRASGLSLDAIADLSAVHISQIRALLPARGPAALKKVRADTAAALDAITFRDAAAVPVPARARVDAEGARLQLQALHCHGWTVETLAAHAGLTVGPLYRIMGGAGKITEELRLRIDDAHRDLSAHRAPHGTELERARAARAQAKAAALNWTPDTELAAERLRADLALAA
jgi:AraC-like DNA-binding protein